MRRLLGLLLVRAPLLAALLTACGGGGGRGGGAPQFGVSVLLPFPAQGASPAADPTLFGRTNVDGISNRYFAIQTNGVDGRPDCSSGPVLPFSWSLVQQWAPSHLTGFQTNAPSLLYCGTTDDNTVLERAVDNAVGLQAHFIEIYENDVLRPEVGPAVDYAHGHLGP